MGSCSAMSDFPVPARVSIAEASRSRLRRRHISPQAGRALEILGHAIEYLTDEFVRAGEPVTVHDARLDAVQLLMGINRQIYFSCPPVPTLGERWRALVHMRTA
ncbi:MAG: hypothetical protein ABSG10_04365 [Terracidiphilus sp.]